MKKTKVSQSTINQIKKMGMEKALKSAAKNPIVGGSSMSAADKAQMEFVEGVRRMYGEKRLSASTKSSTKASTPTTPRKTVENIRQAERSAVKKAVVKKAASANPRQADYSTPKKSTPAKQTPNKVAPKKQSTTSNPVTAAFNKLSPYGNKEQKFKNPIDSIQRKIGATSPQDVANAKKNNPAAKQDKYRAVAAENAKRMGISVAEYNRRINAKKK